MAAIDVTNGLEADLPPRCRRSRIQNWVERAAVGVGWCSHRRKGSVMRRIAGWLRRIGVALSVAWAASCLWAVAFAAGADERILPPDKPDPIEHPSSSPLLLVGFVVVVVGFFWVMSRRS